MQFWGFCPSFGFLSLFRVIGGFDWGGEGVNTQNFDLFQFDLQNVHVSKICIDPPSSSCYSLGRLSLRATLQPIGIAGYWLTFRTILVLSVKLQIGTFGKMKRSLI